MSFLNFITKLAMGVDPQGAAQAAPLYGADPSTIDVFGGQEFGGKATAAAAKAAENPGVADYLQNAMGNYARNKVGKKISGRMDAAADFANAFGDENKTAAGGNIQDISDWFAGSDRKTRDEKRRKQGLYAY